MTANQKTPELESFTVEWWDTTKLIPYACNPRDITQKAIDKVAGSIKEFGWKQPMVVNSEGVIIVGHTRLLAAQKLGMDKVPVHVADDLTPAQIRAYRIADNKTNEFTEWNLDFLDTELSELEREAYDVTNTGFDIDEIDKIFAAQASDGLTDDDAVPEAPVTPTSKSGDIWIMENHRVMCGDSTSADNMAALMDGALADMVFTDPPYNVDFQGSVHANGKKSKNAKHGKILNDKMSDEDWAAFLMGFIANCFSFNKGAWYICMSCKELSSLTQSFIKAGGHWSNYIIWHKNNFTLSRKDYNSKYEPILYGWKEGEKHYWSGNNGEVDVWDVDRTRINDLHPTMKPVELVERAVKNSTKGRDIVLDPFGGSGSTIIASEKTGRYGRLMELDPKYVDVIVKRWQDYTGKQAIHADSKKSFEELSLEVPVPD